MTFVTLSQPPSITLSFVLFSNIEKTEQTSANPWALSNFLKCQQKMVKQSSVASFHRNFLEGSTIYYRQFFELLWLFLSFMGLNLSIFVSFPYIPLHGYQLTGHLPFWDKGSPKLLIFKSSQYLLLKLKASILCFMAKNLINSVESVWHFAIDGPKNTKKKSVWILIYTYEHNFHCVITKE